MIPTPADTLRTRIRPEWKSNSDLTGVLDMIETALAAIGVPKAMKERVAQNKTLNELGLAQALRGELSKAVIPELRRIRKVAQERRAPIESQRAAMAQVKVDPTDVAGASQRQEMRTYLRGLDGGERMKLLLEDSDPRWTQAALEVPAALSGLNTETRAHVQEAYVRANHAAALKALDDMGEALSLLEAAARIAIMEIRTYVGMGDAEFEDWFATADGMGRMAA
jgi:hypothetical protein